MGDPYAHSRTSQMINGSNARLCEAVITHCSQLRMTRLKAKTMTMSKTFARSISARQLWLIETMCSRIPNSHGAGPHLKRHLQSLMAILIVP